MLYDQNTYSAVAPAPTSTSAAQRVPLEVWSRVIALVDCADEDQGPGSSLSSPLPFHSNEMHEAAEATDAYRVRIKQRMQQLRSLPRVCRQWWKPANEALYRHICVSDDFGLECLANTLSGDQNLAGHVGSLSLQCDEHARLCSTLERTCPVDKGMYGTSSAEICRILACTTNLARLDILGGWAGAQFDWTALQSLPLTTFALEVCIRQERRVMPVNFWDCLPGSIVHLSLAGLNLCQDAMGQGVVKKQGHPRLRSLALQDLGGQLGKNVESSLEHVEAVHLGLVDILAVHIVTTHCAASVTLLRYYGRGGAKRTALQVAPPNTKAPRALAMPPQDPEWLGRCLNLKTLQVCGDTGFLGRVSWPPSIELFEWECLPPAQNNDLGPHGVHSLLQALSHPATMPNLKTWPLLRYARHLQDHVLAQTETCLWPYDARSAAGNLSSRGLAAHPAEDANLRRWSPLLAAKLP